MAALALLVAMAAPASAQIQSGTLLGTVRDAQGGVLPGVTVTLRGQDRVNVFVTDATGQYRFLNLPPGRYTVSAELSGFRDLVVEDVVVNVGASVDLPLRLQVGTVQESVVVTGESPIIDVRATGTSTNFSQDELSKIPVSRDPWALLRTVPGVTMDRVNIAGNETGQQSNFQSKGASRADTTWTLDGVVITDMSATGASPTYFDFDAFDEVQVATSGQDIRQQTAGAGLNFVVKRGTNQFRGTARGYFTNDGLEGSNVPDELRALGVTEDSADHNKQITDVGFDVGGPLARDRAWFWVSWTEQDIRLNRAAGNLIDRTLLETFNAKGNWQATPNDMVSVLWFIGAKEKSGRATGAAQVEAPGATWNQGNRYPENRPRGLLKIENNRTFGNAVFLTGRYAYYGTGFSLEPAGGLDDQASISTRLGQTFGTTRALRFLRPQHSANVEGNWFRSMWGATHDFKFGGGYRRHDATSQTIWPGDMAVAFDNSVTDTRARLYREGLGTNRNEYFSLHLGDTISRDRLTLDLGVRYDRQWGSALASQTQANVAFPTVVPGIDFGGYDTPFTWNTVHPRLGVSYALDETSRTVVRANFSRFASQLDATIVGWSNPSANAGFAEYPWVDLNGDRFVQPNEVDVTRVLSFAGGFNPAAPTSVSSADIIDPDLKAPVTTSFVAGVDRELAANLAVQASYTYTRLTDLVGSNGNGDGISTTYVPWIGLTAADYLPGEVLTGTLPDGRAYSVPTFVPDPAKIAANGNGRLLTNYDGYKSTFHGVELSVLKRMADRWMMRAAFSWNNPREFYEGTPVNVIGNPTRTDSNPLVQGGQLAPRSAGSGAGDVFINGQWQVNVNGAYQLPLDFEVAGNVFGRQGNPYPIFHTAALGRDGSQRVLVSPEIDTFRFDDMWNLDLRLTKYVTFGQARAQLIADLFNVFNSNVELNRQRNVNSSSFQRLTQNLSPRIFRIGVRVGF